MNHLHRTPRRLTLPALCTASLLLLAGAGVSFAQNVTVPANYNLFLNGNISMSPAIPTSGPLFYWDKSRSALCVGDRGSWNLGSGGVGTNSVSFNSGVANGSGAAAFNSSTAAGSCSFATGYGTYAVGWSSFSAGASSSATGYTAAAFGSQTTASGQNSITTGNTTVAAGWASSAMGNYTRALSLATVSIGQFNVGYYSSTTDTWVLSDPVFEIGIGTAESARKNALTVLKSGDATFTGKVRVPERGGLSMGTFRNGLAPQ